MDEKKQSARSGKRASNSALLGGEQVRRRKPVPRIPILPRKLVNLLILGLLTYGVYIYADSDGNVIRHMLLGEPAKQETPQEATEKVVEPLDKPRDFNYLSRIFPVTRPNVAFKTLKEGTGRPVLCGQTVQYRLHSPEIEQKSTEPLQAARLGGAKTKQGLTLGLLGMQPGEIRQIYIPAALWKENPAVDDDEVTVITLELVEATPVIPVPAMPLRRFMTQGGASPLRCGDPVIAHMTLWSPEGTLLFDSKAEEGLPIYFDLGRGQVPYGIELGAEEMAPGGKYTIVVPPALALSLGAEQPNEPLPKELAARWWPEALTLPQDKALIVDLELPNAIPFNEEALITGSEDITVTPKGSFPVPGMMPDPVPEASPDSANDSAKPEIAPVTGKKP